MSIRLGIVMDPIDSITVKKDSSLAMLLAAQRRGWSLHYMEPPDLYLDDFAARARSRELRVMDDPRAWYEFGDESTLALGDLDVILMRRDPPFDMDYIYATYVLEFAQNAGALVVNRPAALRDANEKLAAGWFSDFTPPTMGSSRRAQLREFLERHGDIVVKPLDGMGGASVFRITRGDPNTNVILETITANDRRLTMAQRFIPEIEQGDKRILLIDGEPVPFALARIPAPGETRGNLASGGQGVSRALSEHDYRICERVAEGIRGKGLAFVGLDVIGDYLTEVNVTSPTCIRELDAANGLDIAGQLMDWIGGQLQ